ncbi:hypothetical protein Tco_1538220 [Tanacetum coccineum]
MNGEDEMRRSKLDRYESRQEYDANQHKIQLVAHEAKMVTPQEFMEWRQLRLSGGKFSGSYSGETAPDTECVIYAVVHSIQYESGWAYLGCKQCSKKVEHVPTKGPSTSRTKQTCDVEEDSSKRELKVLVRGSEEDMEDDMEEGDDNRAASSLSNIY